jgi:predicted MFS family arabinose efflux permease
MRSLNGVSRNVKLITLIRTLSSVGFSSTIPFLALYLAEQRGVPFSVIGAMFFLQGALGMVSQLFAGVLADRIGPRRTLILGYAFSTSSALYMAYAVGINLNPMIIVVTYPIFSLVRGVSLPAASALVADDKTDLVSSFSMMAMASNFGFAIGPAVGGLIVSGSGYASLFLLTALLLTIGLILAFSLKEAQYHLVVKKEGAKPDKWVTLFLIVTFLGYVVIGQDI